MSTEYYILLLTKQLSQDIDPAEAEALQQWLQQSDENRRTARQVQALWEKSNSSEKTFDPDLDAEFAQVRRKIHQAERPALRASFVSSRLLRIAAACVLLLAALWFVRDTFSGSSPAMNTIVAQNNEKEVLRLPDGTQVWLRKGSTLKYPAVFDASGRTVELEGEAYFDVTHNPASPFRIEMEKGGSIEVLGTRFGVRTGQSPQVLVRSGKVRFTPTEQSGNAVLTAGDRAVFEAENSRIAVDKVLTFNELSWQQGGLEFVSTPLYTVVRDLEKYYQVKIELANPALSNCPYTAPLTNQPIRDVLESLALAFQMRVEQTAPGQFILRNGACR